MQIAVDDPKRVTNNRLRTTDKEDEKAQIILVSIACHQLEILSKVLSQPTHSLFLFTYI